MKRILPVVFCLLFFAMPARAQMEGEVVRLTPSKHEIRSDEAFTVTLTYCRPYSAGLYVRMSSIGFFEAWGDSQWQGYLNAYDTARVTIKVRLRQDKLQWVTEDVPLTLYFDNVPFDRWTQFNGQTIRLRISNFREILSVNNPLVNTGGVIIPGTRSDPPHSGSDYIPPQPVMGWTALRRMVTFPELARRARAEGAFLVYLSINPAGYVSSVDFDRSDPLVFILEIRTALQTTKWIPAQVLGRPASSRVTLPVVFLFDDQSYVDPFVIRSEKPR